MAILVIDDEPGIRALMRAMLAGAGCEVLQAGDGQEALQVLAERKGSVDLVVTDIMMPVMDGFTLSREIWRLYPELRVLFVSAYVDTEVVQAHLSRNCSFLRKPFQRAEFLHVVQDLSGLRLAASASVRTTRLHAGYRHRPEPRFPVLARLRSRAERTIRLRRCVVHALYPAFRELCITHGASAASNSGFCRK